MEMSSLVQLDPAKRALLVLAHPEPRSFNAALARAAVSALVDTGWRVSVSDLYALRFDPVSDRRNFRTPATDSEVLRLQTEERHAAETGTFAQDIAREQAKLLRAHLVIWQFPLWWGGMPAIMKGWIDRVLAAGVAYGGGRKFDAGVMQGRYGLLSLTTGGTAGTFAEGGFGEVDTILHPIRRCILEFVGLSPLTPHVIHQPEMLLDDQRMTALERWEDRLRSIETELGAHFPQR